MSEDYLEDDPTEFELRRWRKNKLRPEATKLQDCLELYFNRTGKGKRYHKAKIVNAYNAVMGQVVARVTRKIFLKESTLFLQIQSPSLKNELFVNRTRLIETLNQEAGEKIIDKIHFL